MKTFLTALLCTIAFATSAFALGDYGTVIPFANTSGANAAVKTSPAYFVAGYKTKSINVTGVTLKSSPTSIAYQNMSGTLIAQGGPTSNGPWVTSTQGQSTAGAAVSMTTNSTLSWQDAVTYVRFQWTASTTGHKIKAWFQYLAQ